MALSLDHDDDIEDIYIDNDNTPPPVHYHSGHQDLHPAVETREAYKTFTRALLGVLLVSTLLTLIRGLELQRFLADFMAIFFIASAGFKFVHLEAFVLAYRRYDLIGSRLRPWAYAVPFLEAFMGFWYLLSSAPNRLNILAILVTGVAAIGAVKAIHAPSSTKGHLSLGGIFRLPLLRLTYIENLILLPLGVLLVAI